MDIDTKHAIHDKADELNLMWKHLREMAKQLAEQSEIIRCIAESFAETNDRTILGGLYRELANAMIQYRKMYGDMACSMVSLKGLEIDYRSLVGAE